MLYGAGDSIHTLSESPNNDSEERHMYYKGNLVELRHHTLGRTVNLLEYQINGGVRPNNKWVHKLSNKLPN